MKCAIICDTHAGVRNDSPVFLQHSIDFFENLFFPYLIENNIKTVFHLGDVFDRRKYINFNTLSIWREKVFDVFQKYNIQLHIILGNHDTYLKNTNEINSVFELLRSYKNIFIYENPETYEYLDHTLLFLPWIPNGKEEIAIEKIKETRATICFGHLEIKGFEMHAGHLNTERGFEGKIFEKFDLVLTGHFHHKSNSDNIYYLGAPYQMSWNDWGDRRGFHLFDFSTRELEYIENPFPVFTKIFYNDQIRTRDKILELLDHLSLKDRYVKVIVEQKENPLLYEEFLDKLYHSGAADIEIVDQDLFLNHEDDSVDAAKDTLTILKDYVNSLDIKNKDKLNNLFVNLYKQALTLDVDF